MLAELDGLGLEMAAQHRDRPGGVAFAAHEYVEGGIGALGPGMHADMGFGEYGDARDTSTVGETVQVDVQQRGATGLDRFAQGGLDPRNVVDPADPPEIGEQVAAGIDEPVALDEIIVFHAGIRVRHTLGVKFLPGQGAVFRHPSKLLPGWRYFRTAVAMAAR